MLPEIPLGTEIALTLLAVLATVLTFIVRRIGRDQGDPPPSDQGRVDFAPVLRRIDQHERQVSQMIQSLFENMTRLFHERERAEHAREVKALEDEIDRLRRDRDR